MGKVQVNGTEGLEPGSLDHLVCCERLRLAASQQSEHLSGQVSVVLVCSQVNNNTCIIILVIRYSNSLKESKLKTCSRWFPDSRESQ